GKLDQAACDLDLQVNIGAPRARPALAPAFVLAGVADTSDVDVAATVEHAPHVGAHDVHVPGLVLVPAAGSDAFGEGVEHGEAHLATHSVFDRADGIHDYLHAILLQQVDDLTDDGDGQPGQSLAELVGEKPPAREVAAFEREVDDATTALVAIA